MSEIKKTESVCPQVRRGKGKEWGENDCARGGQRDGQATCEREEKRKRREGVPSDNGLPVPSPPTIDP